MAAASMLTISESLTRAGIGGLARLDAQLLLLHALGVAPHAAHERRSWLLAHGEETTTPDCAKHYADYCARRRAGEPLAYITGHKEFFGLALMVDARVLVPRPDTETLVQWALEVLSATTPDGEPAGKAALDLGTGSGAIALALKHSRPAVTVDAVDCSAPALEVARANAGRLGLDVRFFLGSWLDNTAASYDCIVSNPPYIAAGDWHLAALRYEPEQALVSGADGLDDLRRVAHGALAHLRGDGWLLLEHGHGQALAVQAMLAGRGYSHIQTRRDLSGQARCTGGCRN